MGYIESTKDELARPIVGTQRFEDTDKDGFVDLYDNCPFVANPNQEDVDEDWIGDTCRDDCVDTDWDGYGNPLFITNTCEEDNCPGIFNPHQEDEDEDGIGNLCDNCPRKYNPRQEDEDKDGIGDECDSERIKGGAFR